MNDSQIACLTETFDAMTAARDQLFETVSKGTPNPDQALLGAFAVFVVTADELSHYIDQKKFALFAVINGACHAPASRATNTLDWVDGMTAQSGFYASIDRIGDAIKLYLDPPKPRRVRVESIQRLREQLVSERQIAQIYQYTFPNGQGDVSSFQEAEETDPDEIARRQYVIYKPAPDKSKYPTLDHLHSLAHLVRQDGFEPLRPAEDEDTQDDDAECLPPVDETEAKAEEAMS